MSQYLCLIGLLLLCPAVWALELNGVVADPSGTPVSGATLWLSRDGEVDTTETDAAGCFTFHETAPGLIQLIAYKQGHAVDGIEANLVDAASIQLVLQEADGLQLHIIDPGAQPVQGARIKQLSINRGYDIPVEDLVSYGFPSLRSDADGNINIPFLPKGCAASAVLSHRNFAELRTPMFEVGKPYDVPLYPGTKIGGRVVNEQGGGVYKAHLVWFQEVEGTLYILTDAHSDADGFYSVVIPTVTQGFVTAKHPEYAIPDPVLFENDVNCTEKILPDLVLPSAHTITGYVLDSEGAAIAGVRVAYVKDNAIYQDTVTLADGSYHLTVAKGNGAVQLFAPDGYMPVNTSSIPVSIEKNDPVALSTITLRTIPEIQGTVINAEGLPQPDVLLTARNTDSLQYAITDTAGAFHIQLAQAPPDGLVRVRADHAIHRLRTEINVDLNKLQSVTMTLKPHPAQLSPERPNTESNPLKELLDKPAPELCISGWINAAPQSLETLRGKVVVLTLWDAFSTGWPCHDRMRTLSVLHDLLKNSDDVVFIAVHQAEANPQSIKEYLNKNGIDFPVAIDAYPNLTFNRYHAVALPQTILIDKKGVVRYHDGDGELLDLIKILRLES